MIGRRERLCYAAGDLGFNFVWQSTELYLLFFYVRVLHLSPAAASGIFLAGTVVDVVTDPLVGSVADRLASVVPLRAWVLAGGPLTVLFLVVAFTPSPRVGTLLPLAAMAAYVLLRFSYSVGNVPYAALTARLSDRTSDHLALTGARMQGAALGGLIAGGVYALLPGRDGSADFRNGAMILAGLSLPAFLAAAFGVTERVAPPRGPIGSATTIVGLLRRSAPLRGLLATILAAGLTVTVIDKSLLFLFEAMRMPRAGYFVALAPSASLLLTGQGWSRLGTRWTTARVLMAAAALALAAAVAARLAPVPGIVIPLTCLAIVAGCGMSVMFWSMVPATVASCEVLSGAQGCAGRVYALANVARKLAGALGPLVVTSALDGSVGTLLGRIAASAGLTMATMFASRQAPDRPSRASPATVRSEVWPDE